MLNIRKLVCCNSQWCTVRGIPGR